MSVDFTVQELQLLISAVVEHNDKYARYENTYCAGGSPFLSSKAGDVEKRCEIRNKLLEKLMESIHNAYT